VDVTRKQSSGKENEGFSRVFISNSGTEANEAALKFVRKWGKQNNNTSKYEVVSFKGSFHGRTFGSLTATANPKYQDPFAPLVPGFKVGELNDVKGLETLITDRTCGVIIEPIQGEGGVNIVTEEFLIALRKRCNEVGALLIFDEIQCGLGRTGKLWAHEYLPSKEFYPDIITIAKSLGNGYPIGATMVTEKVESVLKVGDHGTTYGGNPLGCRIGCYVVNEIARPEFLANVEFKSRLFIDRFEQLKNKYPDLILDIRGKGLLLGLKLSQEPGAIINNSRKNGLLVINCGLNTLRFVPAMNIPNELINEGLDILEKSILESI
jgi:acetylornithine aminotransferase